MEYEDCPTCGGTEPHDVCLDDETPEYEGWHYTRVGDKWVPDPCPAGCTNNGKLPKGR